MKTKFSTRKLISKHDKLILGIFIGCIIMMAYYLLLTTFLSHNYKDFLSQSKGIVTIGLSVFAAMKVLKWYETKRNDKGFEIAQSIIMAQYSCLIVISEMEQLLKDTIPFVEQNIIAEFRFNYITKRLEELETRFRNNHSIANVASASLKKWNINKKENVNDPFNRVINVYENLYHPLDLISKNIYTMKTLDEYYYKWELEYDELVKEMREYNKLSIDDIYNFDN